MRFTARSRILFSSSMSVMPSVSASEKNSFSIISCWHEHLVGREVVVERQRRAVLDALGDRVLVEVALVVVAAERLERPLAVGGLVDRRAGEADVGGVRQAGHQVVAEVAAGRAVGLVDQHVDVLARVEVCRHVAGTCGSSRRRCRDSRASLVEQLVQRRDAVGVRDVVQSRAPPGSCSI